MGVRVNYAKLLIFAVVAAGIAFLLERVTGTDHGNGSLLLNLVFWMGMTEGCVALIAAGEVTHASWHKPMVPRLLSAIGMFPVMAIFFAVYATEVNQYPWAADGGLYLNKTFFIARHLVMIMLGWVLARKLAIETLRGTTSSRLWGVLYAFFFMIHMSMVGFEWVMSLEKPWFSTLFGAWFMVSAWLSAICASAIMLFHIRGQFDDGLRYVQKSIGGLMFGFATFWAYFYFSQLIVIWYGNMPEETSYLARRIGYHTPYWLLARAIFGMVWVIPFATLLSRANKTRPPVTAGLACVILTGFILEFWLCIHPVTPVNPLAAAADFLLLGFLFISTMRSGDLLLPDVGTGQRAGATVPAAGH